MISAVRFLGHEFPPFASIAAVAAGRVAERDGWPLVGKHGSRKVNLIALAEQLHIPYEIVTEEETSHEY